MSARRQAKDDLKLEIAKLDAETNFINKYGEKEVWNVKISHLFTTEMHKLNKLAINSCLIRKK